MARSPDVLEDPTPLDSPRVDIRVRVAWLLRSSRTAGIEGTTLSVTEMAQRLKEFGIPASAPSVSGWETGRVAPGTAVVEAYEAVLGREPGILRGAVDMVRRTHGHGNRGVVTMPSLAELDRLTERVVGSRQPTGLDWLHFCEAALAVQPGLPGRVLRPLVDRLISEVSRSVFTAYLTRYEALALLRCGQYDGLVLQAARDYVEEPGNQVVAEAIGVATERADRRCLRLVTSKLASEDPGLLRGAAIGLENLANVSGLRPADWDLVTEPFVTAYNARPDDESRRRLLSELWRALPAPVRAATEPRLVRPVTPAPRSWEPGHVERLVAFARRAASQICLDAGIPHQPMLARLVYEAAFDPRGNRRWTATLLLMASPFRDPVAARLAQAAERHDDVTVRDASRELLVALGHESSTPHAIAWLDDDSPDVVGGALVELAHTGIVLPDERLDALLELPDPVGRRALYYAGMSGHPSLARIAADPGHRLAPGARWWQKHGTVVTV